MHVVQLGPFPPPHGGVQTNIVAIRDRLRREGHRCSVINLNATRRPAHDDVYYPSSGLEVVTLLARIGGDIIHLHIGGNLFGRVLALALVCAAWPGRRAILTFHSGGYASGDGLSAGYWTVRGLVFRCFDHVITVNEELVDVFRRFGVGTRQLSLVPPFSSGALHVSSEPLPAIKAFFASHEPVVTTVGLLEPEYDLGALIEVMGTLRSHFPRLGLVIIGSGSLEFELRTRLQSSHVGGHVLLFGDMAHSDTLHTIASSRALIRATKYDGDSVAVREALSLGTPVVATDNGMRPRGVRTYPGGDPDALVRLLVEVLTESPEPRITCPDSVAGQDGLTRVVEVYRAVYSGQDGGSVR